MPHASVSPRLCKHRMLLLGPHKGGINSCLAQPSHVCVCAQGGPWGSVFYEGISHHAGFNEWAEANNIVIIYPVMRSWGVAPQTRAGCWDGYAQTGSDYGLHSGAQISVVRNLIKQVAGV
jgi:hypothetical protein